jgi:hypothetical protein
MATSQVHYSSTKSKSATYYGIFNPKKQYNVLALVTYKNKYYIKIIVDSTIIKSPIVASWTPAITDYNILNLTVFPLMNIQPVKWSDFILDPNSYRDNEQIIIYNNYLYRFFSGSTINIGLKTPNIDIANFIPVLICQINNDYFIIDINFFRTTQLAKKTYMYKYVDGTYNNPEVLNNFLYSKGVVIYYRYKFYTCKRDMILSDFNINDVDPDQPNWLLTYYSIPFTTFDPDSPESPIWEIFDLNDKLPTFYGMTNKPK